MTIAWLLASALVWFCPSTVALCNPFLTPISQAIEERRLVMVYWGAYLSGLLRDIILSSPRLGLFAFSSLVVSVALYRLFRFLSIDRWHGVFIVPVLAPAQFFADTLACSFFGSSFCALWSWKDFFLFVILSSLWALICGLARTAVRWMGTRRLRRCS